MESVKIAVVAPTHIPARRANTVQVMKMTQALVTTGHSPRLAVPGKSRASMAPCWDELARHYGLQRQFPLDWLPASPRFRRYDYALRSIHWARGWGADLLYTRLPQAAAMASFLGMAAILEVHDYPRGAIGPILFRGFLRGSGARKLVVITRSLVNDLDQNFGLPGTPFTIVVPDGVDLERYADLPTPMKARRSIVEAQPALPLPPERFTAGYTGHLYPGRGTGLLLEIAARLPEITFLLVGGEPQDVARLRAESVSEDLENVLLTGFVPNLELPRYQAACDVLLMPYQRRVAASSGGDISRYLSPMKLFEYLACGRPILSSDLPVLREILTSENALLLPPDDVSAWVTALQDLQRSPERRAAMGSAALSDAGRYTWEDRASRILDGVEL